MVAARHADEAAVLAEETRRLLDSYAARYFRNLFDSLLVALARRMADTEPRPARDALDRAAVILDDIGLSAEAEQARAFLAAEA